MAFSEQNLGIDFKPNHLVFTVLKKSFRKFRLVDFAIHPLPPETPDNEREPQMIHQINTFISTHRIDKQKVAISIPREKVVARFLSLPLVAKENLRRVIEYESSKYIPFEREEIYFDFHNVKEEKEKLHLFVVFVKKAEVDHYLTLLKKVGIQPSSIQIASTAALNLFFYNGGTRGNESAVLLDITDPFVEMNLFKGKDWQESFHLPLAPEERELKWISTLKRSGWSAETYPRTTFFVHGLNADETDFTKLQEAERVKGVSPPPLNRIETGKLLPRPYQIYSSLGVPLKGLTKISVDINLLPFELRKKVRQIAKPLSILLAFLVLMLTLSWGIGVFYQYKNELDRVTLETKKRKPEVEITEKLLKQKEELVKEISGFDQLRSDEISKLSVMTELSRLLPSTVWIFHLRYTGKEVELSGYADSASDLIPLLDKSPLFEKVEFLAPVTKERIARGVETSEKERFKIRVRFETREMGS